MQIAVDLSSDYRKYKDLKNEVAEMESDKYPKTYQIYSDTTYFISTKGDTLIHVKERTEEVK